jgi:hypothetical protein
VTTELNKYLCFKLGLNTVLVFKAGWFMNQLKEAVSMDNFRRGLHSFFVTGPKMYQLYQTSFNAWAQ